MYGDERDPEMRALLDRISPLNNGVEAWYLLAMDEGHGFRKKQNQDYFSAATVMFFQHLFEAQPD